MATNTASHDSAASSRQSAGRPSVPKPYRTPTLVKGPVLSAVTAAPASVSGNITSDFET